MFKVKLGPVEIEMGENSVLKFFLDAVNEYKKYLKANYPKVYRAIGAIVILAVVLIGVMVFYNYNYTAKIDREKARIELQIKEVQLKKEEKTLNSDDINKANITKKANEVTVKDPEIIEKTTKEKADKQ